MCEDKQITTSTRSFSVPIRYTHRHRGDRTMYERLLPYIDTIISCFKEFEYKWKFLFELPTLDLSC